MRSKPGGEWRVGNSLATCGPSLLLAMTQKQIVSRRERARVLIRMTKIPRIPRKKPRGAERRKTHPTNIRAAQTSVATCMRAGAEARQKSGRARLPALRSGSRRDFHIPAQLQARLPGTWLRRALPAFACPSPGKAPPASVVMPKSMMPETAPARGYESRAEGPRLLRRRYVTGDAPRVSKVRGW